MNENNKFDVVGTNIAEKATMIWNVADMLRGPFKPHEYGLIILPMTVVKRFHDCLLSTHKAVLEKYEEVKKFAVIDGFLTTASQYQFYNISKYTFDSLLADPENIEANFRDYLNGFSANVQDVLSKFDFDNIIRRMVESNTLYLVIKEFNSQKGYLGPDKISAVDCGYIFEDLVKRFSESFGEEAGAHFTSRDIIYLMTDLLLSDADLSKGGNVTVYDMAMGTSQMLSCMEERIQELNTEIGITLGKTYSKDTELVEMPYLRVANVQDGYVDTNDIAVLQVSKDEIEKYSLSAGEVLMTEGGDRDKLGRGCVWDGRITPCLHQNHIFAVKVKEKLLNPHYLEYLTASSVGRTYFDVTAVKTTNLACTSSSKVLAFTIPLPSIDEQNEIVDYLKEKCGCIENVIFKKEQFISELENYKKSLIYEYVTGKKEVPEI